MNRSRDGALAASAFCAMYVIPLLAIAVLEHFFGH